MLTTLIIAAIVVALLAIGAVLVVCRLDRMSTHAKLSPAAAAALLRADPLSPLPELPAESSAPTTEDPASAVDPLLPAVRRIVLLELTDEQRLCLLLGYYEHLTFGEIAEVLDLPVETVEHRFAGACRHVASRLGLLCPTRAMGGGYGRPENIEG